MSHLQHNKTGAHRGWLLAPVLLAMAVAANAQDSVTGPQKPKKSPPTLEEVVVTGSRIARPANDRTDPTIVVSSQTFVKRGYSNVGQALTELPEFGVQPSSQQNDQSAYGVGQSFVDLYSLGSQRTLTLVNGRRFVSSNTASLSSSGGPGSQVDLNDIPIQLIDRVETVSIGGAPIYGADAIAGTVNIITKKHYQGLSLDGQWGTEGYGARNYKLSALAGKNFADGRGNVVGVVEYTYSSGLTGPQVPYVAATAGSAFLAPPVPGKYANILYPNETAPFISTSGVPMLDYGTLYGNGLPWTNCQVGICNAAGQPLAFSPGSSALSPYNLGTPTGNTIFNSGGDGINFVDFENLQARISRLNADTIGHFDWTDHLQTYWEGWFTQAHNLGLATQPLYQSAVTAPPGPLLVSVHNPYLSAADQTTLANAMAAYAASGYFFGGGAPLDPNWNPNYFYLSRADSDLQSGRDGNNDVLARGVLGIKGDFTAFHRDFNWDVAANYGYSRVISLQPALNLQNEQNAVNAVLDSSGQIVCAPGYTNSPFSTVSSTCAPLNPFGYGSPSAAAQAYVTHISTAESYDTQRDVTANLTGPIAELPAGSWKFAAGFENRREAAVFAPDAFMTASPSPNYGTATPVVTAIEGAYHTNEVYAESLIPLFEPKLDIPALHRLEVEGAIRRVDNSLAGNSNTWAAGLRWAPTQDILFRINKTTSIRAPAVTELFLPVATSFEFGIDPCDHTQVGLQPNPAMTTKNCAAAGLNTSTFTSLAVNATVPGTTSGNTALQSEVAHSYTWGVVLTPRWVPHLSVSFNYLDINLTGAISQLNLSELLDACYDSPAYPNVPSCSHFTRNSAGQITGYDDGFVNAGLLHFQGETVELDYQFNLPGNLGAMVWTGNYLDTKTLKSQVGEAPVQNLAGALAAGVSTMVPKGRGSIATTYLKGPFSWYWQAQFSSGLNISNTAPANTYSISRVHSWWLINSSAAYQVTGNIGLRLVVDNVFNKRPPYAATASVAAAYTGQGSFYYSGMIGRTYQLDVHADLF